MVCREGWFTLLVRLVVGVVVLLEDHRPLGLVVDFAHVVVLELLEFSLLEFSLLEVSILELVVEFLFLHPVVSVLHVIGNSK